MLDLTLIQENELKIVCKETLQKIPAKEIIDLAVNLFPLKTNLEPIDLLFKNLTTFYCMKIDKRIQMDQITNEVLKIAKQKSAEMFIAFDKLFKSQFIQKFKKRILKSKGLIKPGASHILPIPSPIIDKTDRKVIAFGSQPISNSNNASKLQGTNKQISISNDIKSTSSKDSLKDVSLKKLAPLMKDQKKQIKRAPLTLAASSTINNNNTVTQTGTVANLSDQDMCFCGKHVSLIEKSKQVYFQCYYCKKKFHTECMKRTSDSRTCTFCHLRKLIPNRQVKKVIFVGLLYKGRKRHEITLNFAQQDLSIQFKVQVRCFRIKDGCQNFVLFPDSVNFSIKNIVLKEMQPLHRQSSLKYRKDEPFYLSSGLHVKQNKLIVTEKHPVKQLKDERINLETHLIGVYVIEQKKVDWLIREMRTNCFTTFAQSKEKLDYSFKNGSIGDQISCEIIKIPLTCSLTTEKIKLPARGIFCSHYQCFDLKNYLELTASSANPRWLCPICKIPSFQFKIDVILHSILQLKKQVHEVTEVIFLKTGQFKVFLSDQKESPSTISNIYDLEIGDKLKRENPNKLPYTQDVSQKRLKPEIILE